jgi:hypothetical protein
MPHADSTARATRPSAEAILRTLEQLAQKEKARRSARASGFYPVPVVLDEFAGLDRLDREELDEEP